VLAATYLTVEASAAGDQALVEVFRQRAIISGAVTAAVGAVAAALAAGEAPTLWRGLIGKALPLSLGAVLIGLGAAAALLLRYYQTARVLVAAEAACILAAWGIAQWPYLIVPDVTVQNAASSAYNLAILLIASVIGMALLLPSLWYLFRVFKSTTQSRNDGMTVAAFVVSLPPAEASTETATSPDDAGGASGPDTPTTPAP
jgi:cytochrome bd ubiquinol oxidase subunit II